MNLALIIVISVILQLFTPWWIIAIIPFVILAWKPTNAPKAFWCGFLGIGLPWLIYGYYFHFISDGALTNRIAKIFSLPNGLLLLLVTATLSALIGGFSALSGYWVRQLFNRQREVIS
jgi:hypothetical protein